MSQNITVVQVATPHKWFLCVCVCAVHVCATTGAPRRVHTNLPFDPKRCGELKAEQRLCSLDWGGVRTKKGVPLNYTPWAFPGLTSELADCTGQLYFPFPKHGSEAGLMQFI